MSEELEGHFSEEQREEMEHLRQMVSRAINRLATYQVTHGPMILIENDAKNIVRWCEKFFRILDVDDKTIGRPTLWQRFWRAITRSR